MRLRIPIVLLLAAVAMSLPIPADAVDATVYEYAIHPTFSLEFAGTEGIIADRSGNVWFGAQDTRAVYGDPRAALVKIDPARNRLYYWYLSGLEQVSALAYDRVRNDIWIADAVEAKLCKFNLYTRQYKVYDLSDFMTDGSMGDVCSIAVDAGGLVYLALFLDSEIAIFDPSVPEITNIPLATEVAGDDPYGIAVTDDGEDIYYTCYTAADAFVHVDLSVGGTATFTEFDLATGPRDPRCILIDEGPDPDRVYFTEAQVGNVGRYSVGVASPLAEFALTGTANYGIAETEDSGTVWVSEPSVNSLARLGSTTLTVAFTTTSGDSDVPDPADVDPPTVSTLRTRGPYPIRPQWLTKASVNPAGGNEWVALTAAGGLGGAAARKVGTATEGWGLAYDENRVVRVAP